MKESSILTSAGCTQSRNYKRKTLDCPSQSVYISLQPSPTSSHTEHKLRRLSGLSEGSDALYDMINNDRGVYLHGVWEHIIPPVNTDDIVGKWFACIYDSKKSRKSGIQLIFGHLISHEVINKDIKINIDCCKPYSQNTNNNLIEEIPKGPNGTPADVWLFNIFNIIAGLLEAKYEGNNKWDIKNIRSVVDVFMNAKNINRAQFM